MLDKLKQAEQARKDEIAQIREANCKRSQDVLMNLQAAGRIRVVGPDGQQVKMPEEERQQRIEEAQAGIVANCVCRTSRGQQSRASPTRAASESWLTLTCARQPDQRSHSTRDAIASIRVEARITVRAEPASVDFGHPEPFEFGRASAYRSACHLPIRPGCNAAQMIGAAIVARSASRTSSPTS